MRFCSRLLCALFLVAGFAVLPAHADKLSDLFTFQISGVPGTGTALIVASPIPTSSTGTSFTLSSIPATYLGSTFTGDVTFFSAGGVGGDGDVFGGPTLFSGPTSSPTFLLGNFVLTGNVDLGNGVVPVTVLLNISSANAVPAVPEPATLALVGTGTLGLVQLVRRRRA